MPSLILETETVKSTISGINKMNVIKRHKWSCRHETALNYGKMAFAQVDAAYAHDKTAGDDTP